MRRIRPDVSRRDLLASAGTFVLAGAATLVLRPAAATPTAMREAIARIVGEAAVTPGRVKLDLPPLVENGNTVALGVTVDSPMTPADFVRSIHVFTEKNPQPNVVSVRLGPRAGRAAIATRIRLADSQTVTAIAETSDGAFWSDSVEVIVTLAACLEEFTK